MVDTHGTAEAEAVLGKPPRLPARVLYQALWVADVAVAKLIGRAEVYGRENVPTSGAFVLAPVHRSNVDFVLAALVTKRRLRYLSKDSVWKNRPLGAFVSFMGGFPVHRGAADREALRTCAAVLNAGEPLVMFPEGTRKYGPVVEDLFDGTAYLAAKTGVPLVPLGIGGSETMMPKGSKLIRPSKLVLIAGEPIHPPAGAEGARSTSRRAVRAMTDELQVSLQKLFDEAQARAGRPN